MKKAIALMIVLILLAAVLPVNAHYDPYEPPKGYGCFESGREVDDYWKADKIFMQCSSTGYFGENSKLFVITGIPPEVRGYELIIYWYDSTQHVNYLPMIQR